MGISSFLLISLYIKSELEYDKFHENSPLIYRLLRYSKSPSNEVTWARTGPGTAHEIARRFPDIQKAARILAGKNVLDPDVLVENGNRKFLEPGLFYADPQFFEIFSFKSVDDRPVALNDPSHMVITESTATKYFGDEDPLGKTLKINGRKSYTIKGVIRNVPVNSHFHFDLVANIQSHDINDNKSWHWTRVYTYLLINEEADIEKLQEQLHEAINDNYSTRDIKGSSYTEWKAAGNEVSLLLQPLESIHLKSKHASEFEPGGDIVFIRIFFVTGILILFLSSINFINLSIAQVAKKARSIGIRKSIGGSRYHLIIHYISESILVCLLSTLIAVGLTACIFPGLNELIGHHIASPEFQWYWILVILLFPFILGILSGIYPALFLSGHNTVNLLKSGFSVAKSKSALKNSLLVIQFCISIGLIISAITIHQQVQFMQSSDRGYNTNLMVIERGNVLGEKLETFKNELQKNPIIKSISASSTVPGGWIGTVSLYPTSGSIADRLLVKPIFTDFDFSKTYGFQFVEGRSYSKNLASDSMAVIINRTAMESYGLESIEGQSLKGWMPVPHPIVGVIEDFNQGSLKEEVEPMVLFANFFPSMQKISVRVDENSYHEAIEAIENTWSVLVPDEPLIYYFLDDNFNRLYKSEIQMGNLFAILSFLAVILASLGLYGLMAYTTEERAKEIAIRKALGATISSILKLLSSELFRISLIASFISIPVTWKILDLWLMSFAYRTDPSLFLFIGAPTVVIIISVVVISGQVLKVSMENPVKRLRSE